MITKLTYTPAEFAELFGKERTWAYRQLYAGKVKAVTEFGRIQIPHSEAQRLLATSGRYEGNPIPRKTRTKKAKTKKARIPLSGRGWTEAIRQRRRPS